MDDNCLTVPCVTYVLLCEKGKYYVGKSHNLNNRMGQHFTGKGSKWTKMFKPVRILQVVLGNRERELTIEWMEKEGWENVRGAGWCSIYLSRKPY